MGQPEVNDVQVDRLEGAGGDDIQFDDIRLSYYLLHDLDPGEGLDLEWSTTAEPGDYYKVQVELRGGSGGEPPIEEWTYALRLSPSYPDAVHVTADEMHSFQVTDPNHSKQALGIPAGDLNGDGYDDVLAFETTVQNDEGDEHYIRILFGGPGGTDSEVPGSAMLVATDEAPADGRLSADVEFALKMNNLDMDEPLSVTVKLAAAQTANNQSLDDLVEDLQMALLGTALEGDVAAGRVGDRLAFWVREFRDDAELALSSAVTGLGFVSEQEAAGYAAAIRIPLVHMPGQDCPASVIPGYFTDDDLADVVVIRDATYSDDSGPLQPEAYLLAGGAGAWYELRTCEVGDRIFEGADFVDDIGDWFYQWRVANVGDFNGDGKDDLAIGDGLHEGSLCGTLVSSRAYLLYAPEANDRWVKDGPAAPADVIFTVPDLQEYGTAAADFLAPAPLGDINGDGVGDFGLAVRVAYGSGCTDMDYMACLFYGVQGGIAGDRFRADQAADATVTHFAWRPMLTREFGGLRGLGDLDGDGKDEIALDTTILRGRDKFSDDNPPPHTPRDELPDAIVLPVECRRAVEYPQQPVAVGDLDGDEFADLGLCTILGEVPYVLKIVRGARYEDDGTSTWSQWMADLVDHPDAVVFSQTEGSVSGPLTADRVFLAGNLDGDEDGRDDLVLAPVLEPSEAAFFHVFVDPWTWAPYPPQGPGQTAVPYAYETATPLADIAETTSPADLASPVAPAMSALPSFGGAGHSDSPVESVPLGDINGDGFDDLLLRTSWSRSNDSDVDDDFILFGPCDLEGPSLGAAEAAIHVDGDLGMSVERPGDYNGDGINDLAFVREDGEDGVESIIITVIPGSSDLPRRLTTSPLPDGAFEFSLTENEIYIDDDIANYRSCLRFLRFNEDNFADLLVVKEQPVEIAGGTIFSDRGTYMVYGYIFSGETLGDLVNLDPADTPAAAEAEVVICQDPDYDDEMRTDALDVWPANEEDDFWIVGTRLETAVAGDINGDGREDLVLARTDYMTYDKGYIDQREPDVSLVTTMTGQAFSVTDDPLVRYVGHEQNQLRLTGVMLRQSYGMHVQGLLELGDIDGDGYDDFAVRRHRENTYLKYQGLDIEPGRGGLLVFRGSQGIGNAAQAPIDWGQPDSGLSQAALILRHSDSPLYTEAVYSLSTGDFNADGRADLAVGVTSWALYTAGRTIYDASLADYHSDGEVYIFWSIGYLLDGDPVVLSEADVILQSEVPSGQVGYLAEGPAGDVTGDGTDDLLIGSHRLGRVYLARGGRVQVALPDTTELLTNRTVSGSGDYLVDDATGEPLTFDRALPAGQAEAWFTFTTLGDGMAGDYLALSPAAGRLVPGSRTSDEFNSYQRASVLADLHDAAGGMIDAGKAVIDLRGLAAGTYYLRVHRTGAGAQLADLTYTLELDVPAAGQALPLMDRDLLSGGGDDVLVGNADIDGLFGQDSADSFYAELQEVGDLEVDELVEFPAGRTDERIQDTYRPEPVDPELPSDYFESFPNPLDEAVLGALAASKGIPLTTGWDESLRLHTTLHESDVVELVVADLSSQGITDLTGLEQFVNLREVNLAGNVGVDLSPLAGLSRLESLNLDNTGITSLADLEQFANLRELSLAANAVTDLSPLAGLARLEFLNLDDTGVDDLTPLAALTNLVAVTADGNAVSELPRLDGLQRLEYLSLADSDIRDLATLFGERIIDDGDAGYGETGEWYSNVHRVDEAHDHDYRFAAPDSSRKAWWQFDNLTDEPYEVLVTWPALPESGAVASFKVSALDVGGDHLLATVMVDQSGDPTGPGLDGRPWASLGVFDTDGRDLVVQLTAAQDGFVAADAARIVPTQLQLPPLDYLSLSGNPLGNRSRDDYVPRIANAGAEVVLDDDPHAPVLSPIGPVAVDTDEVALPVTVLDADGDTVSLTASSDSQEVTVLVVGSSLRLSCPEGVVGSSRITVTAEDDHGRTDARTFDAHFGKNAIYGTKYADHDGSGTRAPDPGGLLGEYYVPGGEVRDFPDYDELVPAYTRVDPTVDFLSIYDPFAGLEDPDFEDHFAVRWTGKIRIDTPGHVEFSLTSDDGSRLYVDGELAVDNPGIHALHTEQAALDLSAGLHDIRLEYFECEGGAAVKLAYKLPEEGQSQIVPADVLYHGTPEPGLDGWEITCTGADSTFTDVNGDYVFGGLAAGVTYTLSEVQQAGWQQTTGGTPELTFATLGELAMGVDFGNHDIAPPIVMATSPAEVYAGGIVAPVPAVLRIDVTFSEPVDAINARAAANYELRDDGGDGFFGDAGDTIYDLVPYYTPGETTVSLAIAGELPAGAYRLTVSGTGTAPIRDLAVNALDGNGDGQAGGDYVADFFVALRGDTNLDGKVGRLDFLALRSHFGKTEAQWQHGDFDGNGMVSYIDYMALKRNTGRSIIAAAPAAVQEPAGQDDAGLSPSEVEPTAPASPAAARSASSDAGRDEPVVDILGESVAIEAAAVVRPSMVPRAAEDAAEPDTGRTRTSSLVLPSLGDARMMATVMRGAARPGEDPAARLAARFRSPRAMHVGQTRPRARTRRFAVLASLDGLERKASTARPTADRLAESGRSLLDVLALPDLRVLRL